jgi:para-aminobenzoate synthetase component I
MRLVATFPIDDLVFWKKQLLYWAAGHEFGTYLDSNEHDASAWECLAAAGKAEVLEVNAGTAFEQLHAFQQKKNDWLFGFLGYDLKNELEALSSQHFDGIGLPDLGFFRPETVASIKPVRFLETSQVSFLIEIQTLERAPEEVFEEIKNATCTILSISNQTIAFDNPKITLQPRIPKSEYLQTVEAIRQHIAGGDLYEMNFCQEFFAENASLHPVAVFECLNEIGKAPFTTFLRWKTHFLLSASPERFLKKEGQKLISQPIKGTRRRGKTVGEDEQIRQELATSEKDRSENVMIVDLVRNDFSRNCVPGSVVVDELCGIYTFATVHQMISTVSGVLPSLGHSSLGHSSLESSTDTMSSANDEMTNDLNDEMTYNEMTNGLKALRDCFPMGSMTGAPKVMAMELIERYERTRRGLYSGTVGYFAPDGDFDFNVIIRSILYNASTGYVSAQVGGAIVYDSVPEQEYEECMVKVDAMMRALGVI